MNDFITNLMSDIITLIFSSIAIWWVWNTGFPKHRCTTYQVFVLLMIFRVLFFTTLAFYKTWLT